jgi:hypothetical protein
MVRATNCRNTFTGWWFKTFGLFSISSAVDVILPIDELIFFKMVRSTTNQIVLE